MKTFEFSIFSYLLNSLWQVPLLFAAAWLAARALRPAGSATEHKVWVTALLLQTTLPMLSILPWEGLRAFRFSPWSHHAGEAGEANVSVVMGAVRSVGATHFSSTLMATIVSAYLLLLTYFVARFAWRGRTLAHLRREAVEVALAGANAEDWTRCQKRFAIDDVRLGASSQIRGPITMGLGRKLVLLPADMVGTLARNDLHTVIAHEFAHMYRNDFLKNLVYESLSLSISYHPLFWLTRVRLTETREMVCDQMAAALSGRTEYARSLLRLASLLITGTPVTTPHAIGIFDANVFERRIMNLSEKHHEIGGLRRAAMILACATLGLGTCGSALALGSALNDAPSNANATPSSNPSKIDVASNIMAGNKISGEDPKYPDAVKKAKIQGKVVLNAVINKEGNIESLKVVSGPKELQQPSLDAVRTWTYKPYLLNGEPISVTTTVNVIYSLKG